MLLHATSCKLSRHTPKLRSCQQEIYASPPTRELIPLGALCEDSIFTWLDPKLLDGGCPVFYYPDAFRWSNNHSTRWRCNSPILVPLFFCLCRRVVTHIFFDDIQRYGLPEGFPDRITLFDTKSGTPTTEGGFSAG